jgi:hypothetical protein
MHIDRVTCGARLTRRWRANSRVRRIRRTPPQEVAAGPQRTMEGEALRCERPGQTENNADEIRRTRAGGTGRDGEGSEKSRKRASPFGI